MSPITPNPLLPVLQTIDPGRPWPETLDDGAIGVLELNVCHLIALARDIASAAEHTARPTGGLAPAAKRLDVLMLRWTALAASGADQVIRTARAFHGSRTGAALRMAVTAALLLRQAEFDTRKSAERHNKSVLNRALAAAEWVKLSQLAEPVDVATAANAFLDHLPPGWRWDTRPPAINTGTDASEGGDTSGEDTFAVFDVIRVPRPLRNVGAWRTGVEDRDFRDGDERIRVSGRRGQPVTVVHHADDSRLSYVELGWAEACQLIARSQIRPPGDATPPTA